MVSLSWEVLSRNRNISWQKRDFTLFDWKLAAYATRCTVYTFSHCTFIWMKVIFVRATRNNTVQNEGNFSSSPVFHWREQKGKAFRFFHSSPHTKNHFWISVEKVTYLLINLHVLFNWLRYRRLNENAVIEIEFYVKVHETEEWANSSVMRWRWEVTFDN